ncbi:hypothetical protein BTS2_3976 [Bacillus sp. TS-2]|nr:hypothetical protein BTS2_3976 [Bacillus sp. TS-2]
MFTWVKRSLLVSTALLSIGLIATNEEFKEVQAEEPLKLAGANAIANKATILKLKENDYELFHEVLPSSSTNKYIQRDISSAKIYTDYMIQYAYESSMTKFGPFIGQQIEKPFQENILPKLAQAVTDTTSRLTDEEWKYVKLSETPINGSGEKIFHLYHELNGEDFLRFHVRRDQPPKQGYWFNFHYHTNLDQYEKHHELGNIYWGKDRPPKWMA